MMGETKSSILSETICRFTLKITTEPRTFSDSGRNSLVHHRTSRSALFGLWRQSLSRRVHRVFRLINHTFLPFSSTFGQAAKESMPKPKRVVRGRALLC